MGAVFIVILLFFKIVLFSAGLLFSVAYLTLFERKVIASMQRRLGPNTTGPMGLLQPIADGLKLLHKETIFPESSNGILFFLAPIISFTLSLAAWAVIPWDSGQVFSDLNLGILYVWGISSLAVYGVILAGWASGSRYALLGGLRSAAQMISYELPVGMILLTILLKTGSLNLSRIVEAQTSCWFVVMFFPLWVIFFICSLAETKRAPFDLPEAEAELVAGYNVEYGSFGYALFYLAEYAGILFMSALNALLFFGGWKAPFAALSWIPGPIWLWIKIWFFVFLFVWVRATLPRFRYDQLMRLGWVVFLPITLAAFVAVSFWVWGTR